MLIKTSKNRRAEKAWYDVKNGKHYRTDDRATDSHKGRKRFAAGDRVLMTEKQAKELGSNVKPAPP